MFTVDDICGVQWTKHIFISHKTTNSICLEVWEHLHIIIGTYFKHFSVQTLMPQWLRFMGDHSIFLCFSQEGQVYLDAMDKSKKGKGKAKLPKNTTMKGTAKVSQYPTVAKVLCGSHFSELLLASPVYRTLYGLFIGNVHCIDNSWTLFDFCAQRPPIQAIYSSVRSTSFWLLKKCMVFISTFRVTKFDVFF